MEEQKEKILFFYTKAGNGHYAVANAIGNELKENGKDVILVDPIENSNKIVKYLGRDFYNDIISNNNLKIIFEFIYLISEIHFCAFLANFLATHYYKKGVEEAIKKYNPDKIINTHFYFNTRVNKFLKSNNLNIPTYTVVTDPFSGPRLWFVEKNNKYIISSEKIAKKAQKNGVNKENLNIFPVIINKKYSKKLNSEEILKLKEKFEVNNGKKNILILSGGTGLPNGRKIIKNIIKENKDSNIIIVCGKSKKTYDFVQKEIKQNNLTNIKLFGFVDFVFELINISDIILTKAGTSTMFEILSQNKVPVICDYIWGQEKGTVDFVIKNNLGVYEKNHNKIGKSVKEILNNSITFSIFENNIKEKNIKNGLNDVVKFLEKNS